jgi:hypothetical protein
MEQQAGSVTTAVPISFAPAVPSHAIKPFSNNHVPDTVDLRGDTKIIVCALAAPGNPVRGPFRAERERQTFWTACASCKKKNKLSIEYLDCTISCLQCSETFKVTEVSRPRNQRTTTIENVHSGAIVSSPGTMVEPSKMTPTVETPLRKKVKREINVTQAGGKHGDNLHGSFDVQKRNTIMEPNIIRGKAYHEEPVRINIRKRIPKDEIKEFLMSKGSEVIATIKGNNVKKMQVRSEPHGNIYMCFKCPITIVLGICVTSVTNGFLF